MNSFDYDPTATYPNVGERGCSSIQSVKMDLGKTHQVMEKLPSLNIRHQVIVALPVQQLEMLLLQDPDAFDKVEPVTNVAEYEVAMAVKELNKHLQTIRGHGYALDINDWKATAKPC